MVTNPTSRIANEIFSFFGFFKPLYSQAEFESLVILTLGFMADTSNKTIAGIANAIDKLKDHSVLSKFLQNSRLSTYEVKRIMKELFLSKLDNSKPIFLYIDDTLTEKAGKKVKAGWNYSVSIGKAIFSNCFVVALAKNGSLELPFDFKKYFKEGKNFKSKIQLAISIVKSFLSYTENRKVMILFDAWYSCAELLNYLKGKGITFITRAKSNRIALVEGKGISLKELAKTINDSNFKALKVNGKKYFVYSSILTLNKIGKVKVTFSKKKRYGRRTVFLITNNLELDDKFIIENYSHRWAIETFFKSLKNEFGFEKYQELKQVAVNRHLTLLLSSYFLVSLVRSFLEGLNKVSFTINKALGKIREVFSEVKFTLLERLYRRKMQIAID